MWLKVALDILRFACEAIHVTIPPPSALTPHPHTRLCKEVAAIAPQKAINSCKLALFLVILNTDKFWQMLASATQLIQVTITGDNVYSVLHVLCHIVP